MVPRPITTTASNAKAGSPTDRALTGTARVADSGLRAR
jgi:hypothetical protein